MKDYLVWDLETSGLTPGFDKINEIGLVVVRDGEVAHTQSWILNHGIKLEEFIINLTGITQEMVDAGRVPDEAHREFLAFFDEGLPNMTHNGWRFDMPFLFGEVAEDLREKYRLPMVENMIDTAVMYKAQKLNMARGEGEMFHMWAQRVMNVIAKGVKYNIPLCCDELGISKDGVTMHRACADALLTSQIYQKLSV